MQLLQIHMLNYLHYIFLATNAHGVHSPFVYGLVTECIYLRKTMFLPIKTMFAKNKYELLTKRLLAYFKPKSILNLSQQPIKAKGATVVLETTTATTTYDLMYIDTLTLTTLGLPKAFEHMHKDSMLLLKKNQTKKSKQLWQQLKESNQVTVTVDLYALGLVFFRTEQLKQDFIIRF